MRVEGRRGSRKGGTPREAPRLLYVGGLADSGETRPRRWELPAGGRRSAVFPSGRRSRPAGQGSPLRQGGSGRERSGEPPRPGEGSPAGRAPTDGGAALVVCADLRGAACSGARAAAVAAEVRAQAFEPSRLDAASLGVEVLGAG
ncbi:MAG: hypothetical protein D6731_06560 [Planctomycetota bacterium]|nr:MAG: hypothetical protein D6731_06560 [Planctomycetota bacterium]